MHFIWIKRSRFVGAHIDLTMLETMAEWMGHPLYYTHFSGKALLAIAALKAAGAI